ncbi:MAG: DUF732 domain-containing protein, partial [Candidatus Dormibacteria bacterium]
LTVCARTLRIAVATLVVLLACGCGAAGGSPTGTSPDPHRPPSAGSGTAPATQAGSAAAVAPADIARLHGILARNGDEQVFRRDGVSDVQLERLFRQACAEIRRGSSPDDVFVEYQRRISGVPGPEGDALAGAFADAWGAGVTTFCPESAGR